jgi:cystathionine beta-synthase
VVVVIFHDHGTRYLGKMFNDDWMRERGFLIEKKPTAGDLLKARTFNSSAWRPMNLC